jgi:DNA-binding NtrC family response regulator
MARILVVDDQENVRSALVELLHRNNYQVSDAGSGEEALELLTSSAFDVIITDVRMNGISGLDLLKLVRQESPATQIIILTGYGSYHDAVEATKQGAFYYLTKPFHHEDILIIVSKALEYAKVIIQNQILRKESESKYSLDFIVGRSDGLKKVVELVKTVAVTDSTVLIQGESGTGKELVARAIYRNSQRKDRPFIVANMGAIPENLLESELFGHVRGAFTGATGHRKGLFQEADQGTFFLDEIGEMPINLQVKILRLIENGEIRRVGENITRKVDIRLIAATNRDLKENVKQHKFREDLYYRLNVIEITIPPLRERLDDIPTLAKHFLGYYTGKLGKHITDFSHEALDFMVSYEWPGNVRELENAIERAVILSSGNKIDANLLPQSILSFKIPESSSSFLPRGELISLDDYEKQYILHVLKKCNGNKAKARDVLGISKSTLWRKLSQYEIDENIEL